MNGENVKGRKNGRIEEVEMSRDTKEKLAHVHLFQKVNDDKRVQVSLPLLTLKLRLSSL